MEQYKKKVSLVEDTLIVNSKSYDVDTIYDLLDDLHPTTPVAYGGTGSSVKRSENWSHPIPSIGLGRHTTTFPRETCVRYPMNSV